MGADRFGCGAESVAPRHAGTAAGVLIFIYGLGMTFPLFTWG